MGAASVQMICLNSMLLWNTCEAGHETKYEFSQSPTVDSATNGNIGSKNFDFGNLALITGWISTCRGFEKITFVPFFVPSENISAEVLS